MTRIIVHKPGFLTTIQDLGRFGYAHAGVAQSGAADSLSYRIGNFLLGNPENTPALEMTLVGGKFEFVNRCQIAITGSDFDPLLAGARVPLWTTLDVAAGDVLEFGATKGGARCYLCFLGSLDIPLVLGSASTYLLAGIGGLGGRQLRKGDVLRLRSRKISSPRMRLTDSMLPHLLPRFTFRTVTGMQENYFPDNSKHLFYSSTFMITEESNRTGLRLSGPRVESRVDEDLISEGVSLGAIQIPPNGQPIILFVEQPTAGGYHKIANIISADLPFIGQLKPRDEISFEHVSLDQAISLLVNQEKIFSESSLVRL